MKKRSTSNELQDLIKQLTTIRKEHVRALEEIENTFRMFGLERLLKDGAGKKRGPKKAATPAKAPKAAASKAPKAAASKAPKAPKAVKAPKALASKAPKAVKAPKALASKAPKVVKAPRALASKAPKVVKAPRALASKAPKAAAPKATKAVKAPKAASKKRGSFEMTGDELILRFVKDKGGATTEQIRKHWEASGRGGKSDNNLTNLVKSGKLLRNKDPNGPGSLYTAAAEASAPAPTTTPSS